MSSLTPFIPLIAGGLGLASASMAGSAARGAGDMQAQAAREAASATLGRWEQARQDFAPYLSGGYAAADSLRGLTGTGPGGNPLTAALTRQYTGADLENTPGYQFTRDQGLKSLYNGYAARGLGNSSAALKGAARYTTDLAQNTFNQQLQNDLSQRQNTYKMLMEQSGQGMTAAGGLGTLGQQYSGQSNALMGTAATAQGAGGMGEAKAWQGLLNPLSQYGMMYGANPDLFKQQTAGAFRSELRNLLGGS